MRAAALRGPYPPYGVPELVGGYVIARRIGLTWLAAELTAAVLAAAVVVALLPGILVLLAHPAQPFLALASVFPVSIPLGAILAAWALRIPRDLLRQAATAPGGGGP